MIRLLIVSACYKAGAGGPKDCPDQSVLQGRLAGSREVGFRGQANAAQHEDQLWNWPVVGCLPGLASEILVLPSFRP